MQRGSRSISRPGLTCGRITRQLANSSAAIIGARGRCGASPSRISDTLPRIATVVAAVRRVFGRKRAYKHSCSRHWRASARKVWSSLVSVAGRVVTGLAALCFPGAEDGQDLVAGPGRDRLVRDMPDGADFIVGAVMAALLETSMVQRPLAPSIEHGAARRVDSSRSGLGFRSQQLLVRVRADPWSCGPARRRR